MDRNKLIANAQKYVQKGQYAKAISTYRKIAAGDPSDVRVLLKIGDLEARNGQAESAIETYRKAAAHFEERGFILKAVAVYKQLQRLTPDDVDLLAKMADAYAQVSLLGEARKIYHELADAYERQGKLQKLASVLRRLVDMDADDVASRMRLIQTFESMGEREKARPLLEGLADLHAEQGRWNEYLGVARRIEAMGATLKDADRRMANAALHTGDWEHAAEAAERALRAAPTDCEFIDILVDALCEAGQEDEAIRRLRLMHDRFRREGERDAETHARRRLRRLDPGAFSNVSLRSRSLSTVAEGAGAPDEDLDDVMTSDDLLLVVEEVDVYLKYGLHDKAVQMLEDGLAYHPAHLPALEKLHAIHLESSNLAQAARAGARIGLAHLEEGDRETAAAWLREAIELLPDGAMPDPDLITLEQRVGGASGARPAPAPQPRETAPHQTPPAEMDAEHEAYDLVLSSDAILPDVLDERLDMVDAMVARGDAVEANHLLVSLLADFPEHSELILSMIEGMSAEIFDAAERQEAEGDTESPDGEREGSVEDFAEPSLDDMMISVDDLMEPSVDDLLETTGPHLATPFVDEVAERSAESAPAGGAAQGAGPTSGAMVRDSLLDLGDLDLGIDMFPSATPHVAPGAAPVAAPIAPGRMPENIGHVFSPSARVLAQEPESALAAAILQRRDGDALSATMVLEEEQFGNHPTAVSWELALAGMTMGLYAEALDSFRRLENAPGVGDQDRALLRYASAVALEALDRNEEALVALDDIPAALRPLFPDFEGRRARCAEE